MKNTKIALLMMGILVIAGCIEFQDVSLSPSTIKVSDEASLKIDIKNDDGETRTGEVVFEKPSTVRILREGEEISKVPFTIDGNGGTWGIHTFTVKGDHIEGQPKSEWIIKMQIIVNGEVKDTEERVLTVSP